MIENEELDREAITVVFREGGIDNLHFISAKTGEGTQELFKDAAKQLLELDA